MNYKETRIKDNLTASHLKIDSHDDTEISQNNPNLLEIDPNLFDSIFRGISTACSNQQGDTIISLFDKLASICQSGSTMCSEFAKKYEFQEICQNLLVECPNTNIILHCLNCLLIVFDSDKKVLADFSNPLFSETLANCIDENGSIYYFLGFKVLSQTIQGYSDNLWNKIVYIFESTFFNDDLSDADKLNITSFSMVFLQMSKFLPYNAAKEMVPIASSLLSFGVFSFSMKICLNIMKYGLDIQILLCLDTQQQSKNSFILKTVKILPFINEEQTMIDTLTVINTLFRSWLGTYQSFSNGICIDTMYLLINSENKTISYLAASIISQILDKGDKPDMILLSKAFITSLLDKIMQAPYDVRFQSMVAVSLFLRKCNPDQIKDLVQWGAVEEIIEFFIDSDVSEIPVDAAHSFWSMAQKSETAKEHLCQYINNFESIVLQSQNPNLSSMVYLLLTELKKKSEDEDQNEW